jgi:hypothetical protein
MRITGMRIDLRRAIPARAYPLMVGITALVLTVSMTIPFASILVVAVLLRRDRWKEIVLVSSLGSATGGLILYLTFHYLGWSQIAAYYPDLPQSKAWADATRWVSAYGTLGASWRCRGAPAANASAHLHRSVAVAGFGSFSRALSGKTAEIWRLWVARCRVSSLVSTLRTDRRAQTSDSHPLKGISGRKEQ